MTIAGDLYQHLDNRIHKVLSDHVHTCQLADIELEEAIKMMVPILLYEMSVAAVSMQLDEKTYVAMCLKAYRDINKTVQKARKELERCRSQAQLGRCPTGEDCTSTRPSGAAGTSF